MPENLIFSLYNLIKFYKEGTPNDDAEIIKFIQENDIMAILKNEKFWGQSLEELYDEVMKYDNK